MDLVIQNSKIGNMCCDCDIASFPTGHIDRKIDSPRDMSKQAFGQDRSASTIAEK
jgi:hypothetical protein